MSGSKPRLTPEQVTEMRALFQSGVRRAELGERYGVSETTIRNYLFCEIQHPSIAAVSPFKLYALPGKPPKLSRDQVVKLHWLAAQGIPQRKLGRRFGLSQRGVCKYLNGEIKGRRIA